MGFFGSLFGSDQAKDLKRAKKASDASLKEGFDSAMTRYDQGYDELEGYSSSGQLANTRYNQLLGLGTDEERAQAQARYTSDPIFSSILQNQSNALLRQQNARGATYGGQSVAMAGRLGLENYNDYLNRLQGQGQTGLQATSQQSNIRLGQGDAAWNYGATRANSSINFGNAMAANRNTGLNNLLNIGGTVAKAAAAFSDIRLKRDIEHLGHLPSGLPYYSFRYTFSEVPHVGVMAHEAMEFFPSAVAVHDSGFLTVDYAQIG